MMIYQIFVTVLIVICLHDAEAPPVRIEETTEVTVSQNATLNATQNQRNDTNSIIGENFHGRMKRKTIGGKKPKNPAHLERDPKLPDPDKKKSKKKDKKSKDKKKPAKKAKKPKKKKPKKEKSPKKENPEKKKKDEPKKAKKEKPDKKRKEKPQEDKKEKPEKPKREKPEKAKKEKPEKPRKEKHENPKKEKPEKAKKEKPQPAKKPEPKVEFNPSPAKRNEPPKPKETKPKPKPKATPKPKPAPKKELPKAQPKAATTKRDFTTTTKRTTTATPKTTTTATTTTTTITTTTTQTTTMTISSTPAPVPLPRPSIPLPKPAALTQQLPKVQAQLPQQSATPQIPFHGVMNGGKPAKPFGGWIFSRKNLLEVLRLATGNNPTGGLPVDLQEDAADRHVLVPVSLDGGGVPIGPVQHLDQVVKPETGHVGNLQFVPVQAHQSNDGTGANVNLRSIWLNDNPKFNLLLNGKNAINTEPWIGVKPIHEDTDQLVIPVNAGIKNVGIVADGDNPLKSQSMHGQLDPLLQQHVPVNVNLIEERFIERPNDTPMTGHLQQPVPLPQQIQQRQPQPTATDGKHFVEITVPSGDAPHSMMANANINDFLGDRPGAPVHLEQTPEQAMNIPDEVAQDAPRVIVIHGRDGDMIGTQQVQQVVQPQLPPQPNIRIIQAPAAQVELAAASVDQMTNLQQQLMSLHQQQLLIDQQRQQLLQQTPNSKMSPLQRLLLQVDQSPTTPSTTTTMHPKELHNRATQLLWKSGTAMLSRDRLRVQMPRKGKT